MIGRVSTNSETSMREEVSGRMSMTGMAGKANVAIVFIRAVVI